MKKSNISIREVLIFVACMFGVAAGLQIDKAIERSRASEFSQKNSGYSGILTPTGSDVLSSTPDFRRAAKNILPSVVSIDVVGVQENFYGFQREVAGQGSGVILNDQGYIVTNAHVVADAVRDGKITVHLSDNRTYPAKIVGVDVRSDIAVIKTTAPNLIPAVMGSSSKLEVGEWVLAVGNPLGQSNTLSAGVVGNIGRDMETPNGWLLDTIQTDAAINPGNSGGALTNSSGEWIGINSAIISPTQTSVGLGFAIPIDSAKAIISELIKNGRVQYAEIGIDPPQRVGLLQTEGFRQMYEDQLGSAPPESGMVISNVKPGSPAAEAGILQYDVVTKIDNESIRDRKDYTRWTINLRPGVTVKMTVFSRGKTREVSLVLRNSSDN